MGLIAAIGLAFACYVGTNVDGFFALVGFMADPNYRTRDVVLGQFLAGGIMTLLCFVLAAAAFLMPPAYVGLLGLIDVAIGAQKLRDRFHRRADSLAAPPHPGVQAGGLRTVAVATAGGFGDNFGVYVPLFAGHSIADAGIFMAVFGAMTGLWCVVGYWLVNLSILARSVRLVGHFALPWLLIAIGILIMHEAGTIDLLFRALA